MDARPQTKVVLGYETPGGFAPPGESSDAIADALLDRGESLATLAEHYGAAERAVEHARDWAARRHPVRTAVAGEPCSFCRSTQAGTSVVCARLIASLEAGAQGDQLYETPPFPVAFPLCEACARRHRMRVNASVHWHRPGVLIALLWTTIALAIGLYVLIYDDAYTRFYVLMTLGTLATMFAGLGVGWLWTLKSSSIPPEPRQRLLWLFKLHSIEVIDLADDRERGVRAVGDASQAR